MNFYCFKPPGLWQCVTAAPGHQHRDLGRQQPLSRYQPWEQQEGDGWVKAGERGCPAWPGVAQGELDSTLEQTLLLPEPCTRPPPGPTPSGAASSSRGVTQKARPAETTDEPDSTPPRTLSGLATLGPTVGKVEAQGRRGGGGGGQRKGRGLESGFEAPSPPPPMGQRRPLLATAPFTYPAGTQDPSYCVSQDPGPSRFSACYGPAQLRCV